MTKSIAVLIYRVLSIALSYLALALMPLYLTADVLKVGVDDYCPHVCLRGLSKPPSGLYVDLLEASLKGHGYTVEYHPVPWNRSVLELKQGKVDILLASSVDTTAAGIFHSSTVYYSDASCFYGLVSSLWRFEGVESLSNRKLAFIKYAAASGDRYTEYSSLQPPVKLFTIAPGIKNNHVRVLRLLLANRVDTVAMFASLAAYNIHTQGLSQRVKNLGCSDTHIDLTLAYLSSSKKMRELDALLEREFIRLKESGDYQKVLEKYHLAEQ